MSLLTAPRDITPCDIRRYGRTPAAAPRWRPARTPLTASTESFSRFSGVRAAKGLAGEPSLPTLQLRGAFLAVTLAYQRSREGSHAILLDCTPRLPVPKRLRALPDRRRLAAARQLRPRAGRASLHRSPGLLRPPRHGLVDPGPDPVGLPPPGPQCRSLLPPGRLPRRPRLRPDAAPRRLRYGGLLPRPSQAAHGLA